jgi:hypothetical protein
MLTDFHIPSCLFVCLFVCFISAYHSSTSRLSHFHNHVDGHYAQSFLKVREEMYTDFEATLVTGMTSNGQPISINYPTSLHKIMALQTDLQGVHNVNPRVPIYAVSWVNNFIYYCVQNHAGNITSAGVPSESAFYPLLNEWLATSRGVSFRKSFSFNLDGTIRAT